MSFEARGLSYGYGSGPDVLKGVHFAIPAGATTAVLGKSGSGKSTLLYLLGLLWDGRLRGEVDYHGRSGVVPFGKLSRARAAALRQSDFGFVLQSSYMLPHFTCAQNAAMPLALRGESRPDASDLLDRLVARVDDDRGSLASVMHNPAGDVSGGQRQRFAVVRAVIHDPRVVLADEPFSSLDDDHTRKTLDLLRDWRIGKAPGQARSGDPRTLILVCHNLEMAWARADYFLFVTRDGRVLNPNVGVVPRSLFVDPDDLLKAIETETLPPSRSPSTGRDGVAAGIEVAR